MMGKDSLSQIGLNFCFIHGKIDTIQIMFASKREVLYHNSIGLCITGAKNLLLSELF
jgi:hypothetical protein